MTLVTTKHDEGSAFVLEKEWCIGGMTYSRHSVKANVAGTEGKLNCMEREKTRDRSYRVL